MPWPLQPGDPVPPLLLAECAGSPDFAGRYAIVALGPDEALFAALRGVDRAGLAAQALPILGIVAQATISAAELPEGVRVCVDVDGASARRLGAPAGQAMVVLCDPRGVVVCALAEADLAQMLAVAVDVARSRIHAK